MKILIAVLCAAAAAVAALVGCSVMADHNYHGTVSAPNTPVLRTWAPKDTVAAMPAVPAVPVTITGSGEEVTTADLVPAGYTVHYEASSWTLIVMPVRADGSEGLYVVDAIGSDISEAISGTTTYRATGRTTFHVYNTQGPWSLTFTPLS